MLKDRLVGTWQLISVEGLLPDGSRNYPYGQNPLGILMYDRHGNMAVQLMGRDRAPFKSADLKGGTAQEAKGALDGAAVYFGTYETDEQTETVCHHIKGSVFPNWIGTVQRRKATVEGSRLVLSTQPLLMGGSESVVVLEWHRVAPSSDPSDCSGR
ncbi:lipocalin-like domain-containing protein [Vitiosangium sp. GDMCC 1.1324]|uniref:lipocalin-like domain-containing protein n=1 Tax=Vitiosangium sp. (strain GDMCC 1.1324) TaxID=2138576 RepID=UPI00130EEC76|nr:lipocalin-like domain-containing protein [Vitiosangium sp. GDMCC 1.1324]